MKKIRLFAVVVLCGLIVTAPARAEVNNIRIALQWGMAWMPFIIMKRNQTIERRAAAAGLGNIKVDYLTFSGGDVMNDALISGNLEYATTGITNFLVLWDKARNVLPVKAVSAFTAIPYGLVTRDPKVKTVADFSDKNRIALPAVKISAQAILLQMMAERIYGPGNIGRFDPITISRSMPDGLAAMISGQGEIDSHFSSPPYLQMELAVPGVHLVLRTQDVLKTPISNGLLYTTQKFRDNNPKLYKVVLESLQEALDTIKADKKAAAVQYLEITKEKVSVEQTVGSISDPEALFTLTPHSVYAFASFMHKAGTMKTLPPSWKDFFFPEVHDLPGE